MKCFKYQKSNISSPKYSQKIFVIHLKIDFFPHFFKIFNIFRLTQYGIYAPLSTTITVIRMRPVDILNNSEPSLIYSSKIDQLAAVGSSTGIIHLIDVCGEKICKYRDLQVHSCPVK